jgi:L,D-peptidoglycan transpeptidase YkuD (ErfK/YbiS/YcfS/YnhG family)
MEIMVWPPGILLWNGNEVRCAIGRGGVKPEKKEGDGRTPAGTFPLRQVMYRPDRLPAPETKLSLRQLSPEDGWCDDPKDAAYNRLVALPFSASHEKLWRQDNVYDVIVELGYNDDPVEPGLGSAIFMHVATPDYRPTEGCVALKLEDLLALLEKCDETARLCISRSPP